MKICIYGNLSSTLMGSPIGGGELQLINLAKELSSAGEKIIIVDLEGDKDFIHSNNLKVISLNNFISKKPRYLKYFYLYQLLDSINADVYHCRIRGWIHIIPFLVCKKNHSLFTLSLASDLDISTLMQRYKYFYKYKNIFYFFTHGLLTELLYPILLKNANIVFAQNQFQKQQLDKRYINNEIILNIFNTYEVEKLSPVKSKGDYFVYVGTLDRRKGFHTFIKVANELKEINFKVVGNKKGRNVEVNQNNNIHFLGRLGHTDTLKVISQAKALLSTSPMEGFPNVFLESWAMGVPVISYSVNPSGLFNSQKLGLFCNNNYKLLLNYIINFDKYVFKYEELLNYVYDNHAAAANARKFLKSIVLLRK